MKFNKEVNHLMDQIEVPASLKQFSKDLPNMYKNGELNLGTERPLDIVGTDELKTFKAKKTTSIRRKIGYFSGVAVMISGLFIGSAFVSPTVANVAANIPYFGVVFNNKPIMELLYFELVEQGYQIDSTGKSAGERSISLTISGTEDYYNEVRDEVEKAALSILRLKGYFNFSVSIEMSPNAPYVFSEGQLSANRIAKNLEGQLKKENYLVRSISINKSDSQDSPFVYVQIPATEHRLEEIESSVKNLLKLEGVESFEFKMIQNEYNPTDFIDKIDELLSIDPELKYVNTSHSRNNDGLVFIITSTVDSSEENLIGKRIEDAVNDILNSKEIAPFLSEKVNEIVVKNKDGNRIN